MFSRRKPTEASLRVTERRAREDAAERLGAKFPKLSTLEITLTERKQSATIGESRYVRRFVVGSAPAHFEFPCTDKLCTDGGHDVTHQVLASIASGATQFEGEHTCDGYVGGEGCGRILRFVGTATYRP
jgi:hypothetical protein